MENNFVFDSVPKEYHGFCEKIIDSAVNGERGISIKDRFHVYDYAAGHPRLFYVTNLFSSEHFEDSFYLECFKEDARNFQFIPNSLKTQEMANKYYECMGLTYQTCGILKNFITSKMVLESLNSNSYNHVECRKFLKYIVDNNPQLFINALQSMND